MNMADSPSSERGGVPFSRELVQESAGELLREEDSKVFGGVRNVGIGSGWCIKTAVCDSTEVEDGVLQ